MKKARKPIPARIHLIQGGVGMIVGVVLVFTPLYEWGIIVAVAAFAFFCYGLVKAVTSGGPGWPSKPRRGAAVSTWRTCDLCKVLFTTDTGPPPRLCPSCVESPAAPPADRAVPRWYYAAGNQKLGPFSFAQLQDLARAGQIESASMVWREGTQKWVPAHSVPGLLPAHSVPELLPFPGEEQPPAEAHPVPVVPVAPVLPWVPATPSASEPWPFPGEKQSPAEVDTGSCRRATRVEVEPVPVFRERPTSPSASGPLPFPGEAHQASVRCPWCNVRLLSEELAAGRCGACGRRLPRTHGDGQSQGQGSGSTEADWHRGRRAPPHLDPFSGCTGPSKWR